MVKIYLTEQLKKLAENNLEIGISIGPEETLNFILDKLEIRFNGFKDRILSAGQIKFVNIFINGEDVRFLNDLETKIKVGDEIQFVPAIAGG